MIGAAAPQLYQGVTALERLVNTYADEAGLAKGFCHLLRLRASQLNLCSYCVRLHTRDAIASGETSDRISLIAAWRDSEYFTDKERAALALVEAGTLIADGQIPDDVYNAAVAVMTEKEVAAVEWITIVINTWNRISIMSRIPVRS